MRKYTYNPLRNERPAEKIQTQGNKDGRCV